MVSAEMVTSCPESIAKTSSWLLPLTAVSLGPLPSMLKVIPEVVLSIAVVVPTLKMAMAELKSMESAFLLRCLNHACDANVPVMSDLFAAQ